MMAGAAAALHARPRSRVERRLVFKPAANDGALDCWLALPEFIDADARPLVAVHGIRRGAEEQAALLAARAAAQGRVVIAPLFDAERWPRYQRLGRRQRADLALLGLLQGLHGECIASAERFDLFGFSGGAQFAHRFAMLHPERIGRLCVASAGWYTFPDAAAYPYGLGQRPGRDDACALRMQARLDAFLRLPIDVCVGARDNRRDANTRSGAAIDRQQGRDRRARASRWSEGLAIEAAVRGIAPRITLSVLSGVGHNFRNCVRRGGLAERVLPGRADLAAQPPLRMHDAAPIVTRRSPTDAWPRTAW
jgi:poly(3-hydroxybutyrate) depolymerase